MSTDQIVDHALFYCFCLSYGTIAQYSGRTWILRRSFVSKMQKRLELELQAYYAVSPEHDSKCSQTEQKACAITSRRVSGEGVGEGLELRVGNYRSQSRSGENRG